MKKLRVTRGKLFRMIMALACVIAIAAAVIPTQSAQAAQAPSPDQAGPYHVGWYLVSYCQSPYGTYNAIVYYPAKWDGLLAPKLTTIGTCPGIIVSNGYFGSDWNIEWISKHLTSYGYIVLAFTPPNIASFDAVQWAKGFDCGIDKLKSENKGLLSPIRNLLDANTFGIIGFSMGGNGAIECASNNIGVDAVVSLAPGSPQSLASIFDFDKVRNAAKSLKMPTMIQVGSNDCFVKTQGANDLYNLVPNTTSKEFVEVTGANHIGYLDLWICPIAEVIEEALGGTNTVGYATQHLIASRYFTSWFQYYLKGKSEYTPYLFGAKAQSDLSSGILSAWEYNKP